MKTKHLLKLLFFVACFCATTLAACSKDNIAPIPDSVESIADRVWAYSQSHPDGFTLNIHTWAEPSTGIAVSYAATQNSHSRCQLGAVVRHALLHDGYVGGWFNTDDSLYYFDSSRLFPEDSLPAALRFGKENGQSSVFVLSTYTDIPLNGTIAEIVERDTLYVGTTGDYRPLSFYDSLTSQYWGFGIEMAQAIGHRLGVTTTFVPTSWPTLSADVLAQPPLFDFAIGGITITAARQESMAMSEGYLANGKTILCRSADTARFHSLADVDQPGVRVMVNPGGLNEQFARQHLTHATIIVHPRNEEIPSLIATGMADIMITEITEAPYYVQHDSRLAAPLLDQPFTHGEIGVLMRQGQDDLLQYINDIIAKMKSDGSLRRLHEKYGLSYKY